MQSDNRLVREKVAPLFNLPHSFTGFFSASFFLTALFFVYSKVAAEKLKLLNYIALEIGDKKPAVLHFCILAVASILSGSS